MVHIQTQSLTSLVHIYRNTGSQNARQYWMLQNHDNDQLIPKRELLDRHHARYNTASSRARLETLCHRVERGLYVYDRLPVDEMQGLVSARRLRAASRIPKSRKGLMRLLEQADEEATFPLLDLPAELRNMVYTHHLQALRTNTGMFLTLPPITRVSKLVRKESMPLFYENCTVHFDYRDIAYSHSRPNVATRFLRQTDLLAGIRNICITGVPRYRRLPRAPDRSRDFALRFSLQIAKNNRISDFFQIETIGSTRRLDAKAAAWSLSPRDLLRVERFQKRLQVLYQKLVKRQEEALLEPTVEDETSGDKVKDSKEIVFVERPESGLRLRVADFDELLELFRRF